MMKKRNVVLLQLDALRFDCVPYQTNQDFLKKFGVFNLLDTPNLARIAKESLCFSQAISVGSYTTAAHASVFTGLYPPRHHVRGFMDLKIGKLAKNVLSLPDVFKENGYVTVLLTDVPSFYKPIELDRGFDKVFGLNDKKMFAFIKENRKKPIFLFAHFFDIHHPYLHSSFPWQEDGNDDYFQAVKEQFEAFGEKWPGRKNAVKLWNDLWGKKERQKAYLLLPWYIKGISKFDKGRFDFFLKELDKVLPQNNRVMVVFSDHGEGRCKEDPFYFSHAGRLYDSVIRIPLMISTLGLKPGIDNRHVSLIDIFPTVIDLAFEGQPSGLPRYELDGISLKPSLKTKFLRKKRPLYCETWKSNNPQELHATDAEWILRERCIRTPTDKYIVFGEPERLLDSDFYDLPNEEFLKHLYRALFYRFEDKKGMEFYLPLLNKGEISKKELANRFLGSHEHQDRKSFSYYSLLADPEENFPIDPVVNQIENFSLYLEKIWETSSKKPHRIEADLNLPFTQVFECWFSQKKKL